VRELRRLKRQDPNIKSLVFSQWSEALLLLREALTVNSVSSLVLSGGAGAVETLRRFRESSSESSSESSPSSSSSKPSSGSTSPSPSSSKKRRGGKSTSLATAAEGAAAAGKALEKGNNNKDDGDEEEMGKMNDGSVQVLLMPLKATNAGLSISEATHVFLLDTGLNRGLEIQALARVRRINSTQTTTVHRLIMQGTIEEAIWNLLRPAHDAAIAASTASCSSYSSDSTVTGEGEGCSGGGGGGGGGSATQKKGDEGMASLAARYQVRRSDVHKILKKLKYLYHAGGGGGGGGSGGDNEGKKEESSLQFSGLGVRPEWRERILQGLG